MLASNKTIYTLYCNNNGIGDQGAQALEQPLEANYTLTELYLSRNRIGSRGAAGIASALKSNRALRILDLSSVEDDNNRIGDDGAVALSQAIAINNVLHTLLLNGKNDITARGAGALATGLSMAPCGLQILNLSGNRLGLGGAKAMAHALKQNQSLLTLQIANCELTDAGCVLFSFSEKPQPLIRTHCQD